MRDNNIKFNNLPPRKVIYIFFVLVTAVFSFMASLYWKALILPMAPGSEAQEILIEIPEHSSCAVMGKILYQKGLARSPELAALYARLHNVDQKIKPGRYLFNAGQSLPEIVGTLVSGPPDKVVFTVPEGYTLSQLANLLAGKGLADKEKISDLANHPDAYDRYAFLKGIPDGQSLEGYLFPDTYQVGMMTGENEIISMMLDRFAAELKDMGYEQRILEKDLTLHQAVTIASMIEGEAKVNEERAIIASVIYNRLNLGMPLQIDATVKYALGGQRAKIYFKDLEINSPYNTYKIAGLPPGPINSPGRASLMAVVQPASTDYLYYVAKPDGTHAFSSNLADHNANMKKYQQ